MALTVALRIMFLFRYICVTSHLWFCCIQGAIHLVSADNIHSKLERRQIPAVIGAQNFMRRAWQTSAVAGTYLYIDGGDFAFKNGDSTIFQYSSTLLSIDLSRDWVNETVVIQSTSKPSGVPKLSSPSFWYDENKRIFYTGITGGTSFWGDSPKPPPLSLWSFKPDGTGSGSWREEIPADDPVFNNLLRSVDGSTAVGGNTALVLGGKVTPKSDQETINSPTTLSPGLLEFDMTSLTFTNFTVPGFSANGTVLLGRMHFVPSFGPQGIFLAMGGSNNYSSGFFSFDNIRVYEAVTRQWYNQTVSGYIPEPRNMFCVAGVNSTEGTYEIFLYGGYHRYLGPYAVPYDEVFILTLPAFRWFKVDYPPQYPRGGHSCNAVGGSQIISVGGFDANPKIYDRSSAVPRSVLNSSADPFAQGLGIFNMTSLTWADHFTANAPPYTQPEVIKNFYRNNPPNGSQFSTTGLKGLFQTTHFTPAGPPQSDTPQSDSPKSDSPQPSTMDTSAPEANASSSNTASIAGGVAGGIGGLAVIVGAAIYFYISRRKRQESSSGRPQSDDMTADDSPVREHSLQEADADAEYKGAQLESHEIHEMQHPLGEMAVGYGGAPELFDHTTRYEMEAT